MRHPLLKSWIVVAAAAPWLSACTADLRSATAATLDCPLSKVAVSDEAYGMHQHTWSATCGDARYLCEVQQQGERDAVYECQPAPSADPGGVSRSEEGKAGPPTMVGGFQIGTSDVATRAACEEGGMAWNREGARWRCTGTPVDVGFSAQAVIRFCGRKTCGVTLRHRLDEPSGTGARAVFNEALRRWSGRYGAPRNRTEQVPVACESKLAACLKSGKARISAGWAWPTGERLSLGIVNRQGQVLLIIGAHGK